MSLCSKLIHFSEKTFFLEKITSAIIYTLIDTHATTIQYRYDSSVKNILKDRYSSVLVFPETHGGIADVSTEGDAGILLSIPVIHLLDCPLK